MPPSKMYKKKPSLAKAKKMVTKYKSKRAAKNMDTFFLRAKSLFNVVPLQGTSVANYVYNAAAALGGNLLSNAEFVFYRMQYDKFRVNSVTVKWTPKANVLDQAAGQDDAHYNLVGDGMIHTCLDRDGAAPSSIAAISRYPSYRKFSVMKKWSRTYKTIYPAGVWLDCQAPFDNTQVQQTLGLLGGVTWYAENFLEDNYEIFNEPIAEASFEWNVVFQGKTSGALGFNIVDGVVTGVYITPVAAGDILAVSPLQNVRGTIDDKRTIDEVTEVKITDQGVPA